MIQNWTVNVTPTTKGQRIFEECNLKQYSQMRQEYDNLSKTQKAGYKGADSFISQMGGPTLSQENKNYKLLVDEIDAQLRSDSMPELFQINVLDYEVEIHDLLSSLENEKYLKGIYQIKKLQVKRNSGINTKEATSLMECIRQGRSLLQAGLKAEMLAKPLIDFYAASAYAFAIIVLNSPLHKSMDSLKGSHGHTYNHTTKTIDFGGEIPSGTFSDLLCALPVASISQKNAQVGFKYSVLSSIDFAQKNSISISLLPLLSMVPELGTHFDQLNSGHKSIYRLNVDTSSKGYRHTYDFHIHGEDEIFKPEPDQIKRCFNTDNIHDEQGGYRVSVDFNNINSILPVIYQDMYGQLWYVESPVEGLYLPEICLHFLIISALCNIMRYSPHEWSDILTNRISSQFSLAISQYIRIFEKKFPLLAVQCLTNYNPIIQLIC